MGGITAWAVRDEKILVVVASWGFSSKPCSRQCLFMQVYLTTWSPPTITHGSKGDVDVSYQLSSRKRNTGSLLDHNNTQRTKKNSCQLRNCSCSKHYFIRDYIELHVHLYYNKLLYGDFTYYNTNDGHYMNPSLVYSPTFQLYASLWHRCLSKVCLIYIF